MLKRSRRNSGPTVTSRDSELSDSATSDLKASLIERLHSIRQVVSDKQINGGNRSDLDVELLGKLFPEKYSSTSPHEHKRIKIEQPVLVTESRDTNIDTIEKLAADLFDSSSPSGRDSENDQQEEEERVNKFSSPPSILPNMLPFYNSMPITLPGITSSTLFPRASTYRTRNEENGSEDKSSRANFDSEPQFELMQLEKSAYEAQIRRDIAIAVYHERLIQLLDSTLSSTESSSSQER